MKQDEHARHIILLPSLVKKTGSHMPTEFPNSTWDSVARLAATMMMWPQDWRAELGATLKDKLLERLLS